MGYYYLLFILITLVIPFCWATIGGIIYVAFPIIDDKYWSLKSEDVELPRQDRIELSLFAVCIISMVLCVGIITVKFILFCVCVCLKH